MSDKVIRLIGCPIDLGAGRRGVDSGPSAIRIAGASAHLEALGFSVHDDGDVSVPNAESCSPGDPHARFLPEILDVCDSLRKRVVAAMAEGHVPLVLGGDHSMAIGTISGVAEYFHRRSPAETVGVIWVDAHADMNTPESSPSGNIHGMPLAVLLGRGPQALVDIGGFAPKLRPENVCLVGIRNLDEQEKATVRASGVHAYTMRDIDERGMSAIAAECIEHACHGTAGFHVSFDLDGMDPRYAPGVGTPVKGGIDWRESNLLLEMVADSGRMTSLEITELNPILDDRNRSGEVAVDLIDSAFGKRIL